VTSATSRQRRDSRRSEVTERARTARRTLRLELISNGDVGEMVKRAREAGKRVRGRAA